MTLKAVEPDPKKPETLPCCNAPNTDGCVNILQSALPGGSPVALVLVQCTNCKMNIEMGWQLLAPKQPNIVVPR